MTGARFTEVPPFRWCKKTRSIRVSVTPSAPKIASMGMEGYLRGTTTAEGDNKSLTELYAAKLFKLQRYPKRPWDFHPCLPLPF